ncbi:TonB-dependent receptor plug domain-containing protein [Marinicella meishanensis]|uniref:TonB-dependent receptor plug domain-containing protein n=1 Tax=Marinicella meishanensis TaxID=2873263 RepID=UPI001CBF0943|nr:TonB-dependent receptor [Marinicella sp. NBU2979]
MIRAFLLCWLAWMVAVAKADETSMDDLLSLSLEELLNYEVSAPTKGTTRLADAPGSVSVITYDQIRNSGANTIPELLRQIPGVHVRWNPMVQSIEIRSFGSNPFTSRVLLLIDGIPYNSWNKGGFPQHPGFDFFNLENVKHLEVIRGPGSALYGENALNGVINIVTLTGEEYRQTRFALLAGDRDTLSASVSHGSLLGEAGSLFISARTERTQLPTAFWEGKEASGEDFFIKAIYQNLQLSYYRRQDDFDGFSELIVPPDFSFSSTTEVAQKINIITASYEHTADNQAWSVKANASYADRDGTHCGGCHAVSQNEAFNGTIDHGYQKFFNAQLGWHALENHDLTMGIESRRVSSGDSFDQVIEAHIDGAVDSFTKSAVFVQDRMTLNEDKTQLVAGVRYDAQTSPSLFDAEWFPRIAVVHKALDDLTLRAGWSSAARYPSFTELYQNIRFFGAQSPAGQFAFPPTHFQPNPDLMLEKVDSLEVGLEYRFNERYQGKIDLFYNQVTDPIVLTYGAGVIGFENHPNDATIKGLEVEFRAKPSLALDAYVNWSYQNNTQQGNALDSNGMPIEFTYAPKHKINMGLQYQITDNLKTMAELSWRDRSRAPQFWSDIVFGDGLPHDVASNTLLNVRLRYRLPFELSGTHRPLTLNVYVKNMFDEKHTETLTGVDGSALGREFFVGFDYEWSH